MDELKPRICTNSRLIPLTQNKHAIVDAELFDWLNQWKWHYKVGYARTTIERKNGKQQWSYMHSLLFGTKGVDHINGNGLDNRESNLRVCSHAHNLRNQKLCSRNTTGFKGVCYSKASKKFVAHINLNGHMNYLGLYENAIDAAKAYDAAALGKFGEFAKTNKMLGLL